MLRGFLGKLGAGKTLPTGSTDPAALAERERNALIEFLAGEDHSLVIDETPRGATLSEDDDIISFEVDDDLSSTIVRTQGGEETDRRAGLTPAQLSEHLAEMLHDHLTGWVPAYHAERRALRE